MERLVFSGVSNAKGERRFSLFSVQTRSPPRRWKNEFLKTFADLVWCVPAVIIGSWFGVKLYPYLNGNLFKRIIIGLILLSGITLLI